MKDARWEEMTPEQRLIAESVLRGTMPTYFEIRETRTETEEWLNAMARDDRQDKSQVA